MKYEEKITKLYLDNLYKNVVFEPDGNIPPDFKINSNIAVEVRRLNQNDFTNGLKTKGLETDSIPLRKSLSKLFLKYKKDTPEKSYFVSYRFTRPIEKLSSLIGKIESNLDSFLLQKPQTPYEFKIVQNFDLILFETELEEQEIFCFGCESDMDTSGWTINIYTENINHCIAEKTQ